MARKKSHKFSFCLSALLLILLLSPAPTLAWGNRGHQIIARVAMTKLSTGARQAISELLEPGETLESVSGWADEIKLQPERLGTRSWHVVAIPLSDNTYARTKDCGKDETCIIDAIAQQVVILKDMNKDPEQRAEALKFLVHLVGDLHQPFHVTTNTNPPDQGANRVRVTSLSGRVTNLHEIWDSDLVEYGLKKSARSVSDYANQLNKRFPQNSGAQTSAVSSQRAVTDWALETHKYAWDAYYHSSGDFMVAGNDRSWQLDESYYGKNVPAVEGQLVRAGARLARLLNEILGARASSKSAKG